MDRPHGKLRLDEIIEGMRVFSKNFKGELVAETMLIHGVNDGDGEMENVASFISELNAKKKLYLDSDKTACVACEASI